MGIKEKNLPAASGIASGDLIREVTSGGISKCIDYDLLAKAIIENYNGSTIAGSAQTLQAAINSLNSKIGGFKEIAKGSISGVGSATINVPTGAFLVIAARVNTSSTTSDGMWIGNSHTSTSHVTPVLSSSTITASFTGQILSLDSTSGTILYRAYSL